MMKSSAGVALVRILPVLLVTTAAIFYIADIEGRDAYVLRNVAPMVLVVLLATITVVRGNGYWTAAGWRWPLGTLGFAVPAIGLSLYLHYGYSVDLNGMYSESVYPRELFRYLPAYTIFAGGVGFAIGWIVGRNL
jgi:hypothetical protein